MNAVKVIDILDMNKIQKKKKVFKLHTNVLTHHIINVHKSDHFSMFTPIASFAYGNII